jgi:hypothetical protein
LHTGEFGGSRLGVPYVDPLTGHRSLRPAAGVPNRSPQAVAPDDDRQRFAVTGASRSTGTIGGRRASTVSMISVLSIPCR